MITAGLNVDGSSSSGSDPGSGIHRSSSAGKTGHAVPVLGGSDVVSAAGAAVTHGPGVQHSQHRQPQLIHIEYGVLSTVAPNPTHEPLVTLVCSMSVLHLEWHPDTIAGLVAYFEAVSRHIGGASAPPSTAALSSAAAPSLPAPSASTPPPPACRTGWRIPQAAMAAAVAS